MISTDTSIIMDLFDTLDYSEYCAACLERNFQPSNIGVFLQRAGMVMGAKRRNPDNPEKGYLEIIDIMNDSRTPIIKSEPVVMHAQNKCGGCAGGIIK